MKAQSELKLALLLLEDGNPEEALEACERALKAAPDHHLPRVIQGSILTALGRFAEATRSLRRVIRRWPELSLPRIYLAENYYLQGNNEDWTKVLKEAKACPDSNEHAEYIALMERSFVGDGMINHPDDG